MQKYTVFIKPLTMLTDPERETLRTQVNAALHSSKPVQVGANEFEIEVSDDKDTAKNDWIQLRKATDGLAFLVWYGHKKSSFTVSPFPSGASDELSSLLQSPPDTRLQGIRQWIRAIP